MQKILNLSEAYRFYVLTKPYFPEYDKDTALLEFLQQFLTNIDEATLRELFGLFLGESAGTIEQMGGMGLVEIMVDCFHENQVIDLVEFFNGIIDA